MATLRTSALTAVLLLNCSFLLSQTPMEPRARLQARIDAEPRSWLEGFSQEMVGTNGPYESHRSNGKRDPAVVVRTNDINQSVAWRTQEFPADTKSESVRFLWTCGFGSNQGSEPLDLFVNGEKRFSFKTLSDSEWTVAGTGGGRLTFTQMGRSQYGASLGYMVLEVPSSWCLTGKPLSLQIKPAGSKADIWYRLYKYDNSLRYFLTRERRQVYSNWKCYNFGDATLTIVAQANASGRSIAVSSPKGSIGKNMMVRHEGIARAEFSVPRAQQYLLELPILVRIEQGTIDTIETPTFEESRIKAFMEEEIVFEKFIFPVGDFPSAAWKNPHLVANLIGTSELKLTFFNGKFERVVKAEKPGRYGALIACTTVTGFPVRRFATLYCIPSPYEVWMESLLSHSTNSGRPTGVELWNEFQRSEIARFLAGKKTATLLRDPEAAVFFAGLSDMKGNSLGPNNLGGNSLGANNLATNSLGTNSLGANSLGVNSPENDSPRIHDRQWWIDFKRTVWDTSRGTIHLRPPVVLHQQKAPILTAGDPLKLGFRSEDIAEIRAICSQWAERTGEPNSTLIAYDGQVFFEEAFGKNADGTPRSKETPTWMASITKLIAGTLAMQFVDQGFLELDAPVAKYLTELPKTVEPVLTVRDLFTHTNGFGWHGEWASDWNMTLENYLAQCLPVCRVRERHQYNRMGYAVAGKILERLAGRSVPSLYNEYLLKPLGMSRTFVDNTYGSCQSTAYDIALLGQMLLNRGAAGGNRFFSEESFERMLPQVIMGPKGRLEPDWGIGTTWLGGNGLSKTTFGHEAASGALLRIDPELHMVLVSARDRTGPNYTEYESFRNRLLEAAAKAINYKQAPR
jgi:CubicO group peptidase (beta-lactamase class C family)